MARRAKPDEERTREWLDFHWLVPENGYEWVDGRGVGDEGYVAGYVGGPWLVARPGPAHGYSPWSDPERAALFRDLADVAPERGSVLAFANRFGSLGFVEPGFMGLLRAEDEHAKSAPMWRGEQLRWWVRETSALRAAVDLVEAARNKNQAKLERWIQRYKKGAAFSRAEESADGRLVWSDFAREGQPVYQRLGRTLPGLGLLFAQKMVNERLLTHTTPRVLANAEGKLVLAIRPAHLLGAAWLQLAQWMTGESTTQYRRCAGCPKWLAIGPGVGRDDRTVCGDTCRKRAKRAEQRAGRKA